MTHTRIRRYCRMACISIINLLLSLSTSASAEGNFVPTNDVELCRPHPAGIRDKESIDMIKKAENLYSAGMFSEAIRLYTSAYEKNPICRISFKIVSSYLMLGQCDNAAQIIKLFPIQDKGGEVSDKREAFLVELHRLCPTAPSANNTSGQPSETVLSPEPPMPSLASKATQHPSAQASATSDPSDATKSPAGPNGSPVSPSAPPVEVSERATVVPAVVSTRTRLPLPLHETPPWHKRWWIWTSVAGVAATAAGIGIGVWVNQQAQPTGVPYSPDYHGPPAVPLVRLVH